MVHIIIASDIPLIFTETNFPHKLLLSDTQILRLCKAFANNSSAHIKLSKTQLSKMVQF